MNSSHAGRTSGHRTEVPVPELDASRFELLNPIGSGGMGTVYRAVQRSVGRHVAIKILSPEHAANASGLARFVREANIIARLTHPNLVQLVDFGRDREGRLLLVMELLEGESLRPLLRRESRLAPERAAYITVQSLNALRVAHAAGVIHRDLKPENIFLHRAGDDDHVKVLDFGVAKLTQGETHENTTAGSLVGTLRYMAPEQIAGEAPDARIDVYSMGMVLYEALSGAMPYDTRDRFVLLRQIIADEPAHLLTRAPDIAPALADVVMRAIQKVPADRFQTVDEFRRALMPFLGADHARLQALADASGRPSATGAPPSGEIRSGIVRSGHLSASSVGAAAVVSTGVEPAAPYVTGNAAPMPVPSSYPSGPVSAQVPQPVPLAPVSAAPAPATTQRSLLLAALVAFALVGFATVAAFVLRREGTPAPAPPAAVPPAAPTPSTRMVLVVTTPAGAQVLDGAGQSLCPATPCAIPVPVGRPMPVRVIHGAVTLNAALDPNTADVRLDLTALAPVPSPTPTTTPVVAPPTTPTPPTTPANTATTQRRVDRRREPAQHPAGNGGDDLPMFLPH